LTNYKNLHFAFGKIKNFSNIAMITYWLI